MKLLHTTIFTLLSSAFFLPAMLGGCGEASPEPSSTPHAEATPAPTNRIDIPPAVRSNLGITFAPAERRHIEDTLRAPGTFEYLPTAVRTYQTMLPGRVDILVNQFELVEPGTPLYRIDSPEWREVQRSIAESDANVTQLESTVRTFDPLMKAHRQHERSLHEHIDVWRARVERLDALRAAGGGRMSELTAARSSLTAAEAELANVQEKDAELHADQDRTHTALEAAKVNRSLAIDAAAALLDLDPEALLAPTSVDGIEQPQWRSMTTIAVVARKAGVVESVDLTNGAWANASDRVLTVVQPDRLRFHASGLQSDLGVLRDGLPVTIVPPTPTATGTAVSIHEVMRGSLSLGLAGNADERTLDLYVTPDSLAHWARPGVRAQLEIVTDSSDTAELAIPLAAVQQDGLEPIIFRRDPMNPNKAIRIDADLGLNDGRWVAVLSGLRDGDEVVLDGGFQLMLATSGSVQQGGHFHADGTFHEGED